MKRQAIYYIIIFFVTCTPLPANSSIELVFEDFNDQDIFNNFSGSWGELENSPAAFQLTFDTANTRQQSGASLKIEYDLTAGSPGWGGMWQSIIGKDNYLSHYLDFTDLYGDLANSAYNPADIEDVAVTGFSFWAKGNGTGAFTHSVKVELKDIYGAKTEMLFSIPNIGDWTRYDFPATSMGTVDLEKMKQVVFVIEHWRNDDRASHFYIDDLSFVTSEQQYDAFAWSDDQFLDLVAHRAFKYFLENVDSLGFALDRSTFNDLVSVGAIGFQLAAYCIGHQREWADNLESRVLGVLQNLSSLPMGPETGTVNAGYKGFFYHFLEANTGKRKNDTVELSLYDTMLLMYGVLVCKEYFGQNDQIQILADNLYDAVEWSWLVDPGPGANQDMFYLAWLPESGFEGHVDIYTDEALLVDVLALGSDTYPITRDTYNARSRILGRYPDTGPDISAAWTGSLFNYFFGACWLDLLNLGVDRHATVPLDIWENNKRAIEANRAFCKDHSDDTLADGDDNYATYGENSWGLTACDNLVDPSTGMQSEYYAFGALPTLQSIQNPQVNAPHLGTLAVYGAGASIPFFPAEATAALKNYYGTAGLWSPLFGFVDAFSLDPHTFQIDPNTQQPVFDGDGNLIVIEADWLNGIWLNHMKMGIDEGPVLLSIENYRSGMLWDLTNENENIRAGLDEISFASCTNGHIKIEGASTLYSTSIGEVYKNHAENYDVLYFHALEFLENLHLNEDKTITLKGGFDCDFIDNPSFATIDGYLSVENGSVILESIVLQ